MTNRKKSNDIKRYIIKVYGIVQGVGFRPFVYKKAKEYHIYGSVENIGGAVVIDCYGQKLNIKHFLLDIIKNPPSLSKIERIQCAFIKSDIWISDEINEKKFLINKSVNEKGTVKFISPDVATCSKCLDNIKNKENSRYGYAFTNCTECGPRYSIIKDLPYDRHSTTMKNFYMCNDCEKEYYDPMSRRFHAQPNCCEKCGPKLFLLDNKGNEVKCKDIIKETIKLLKDGKILAIKGLGGFHLVCDGRNEESIKLLRIKKHRKDKPLALMIKDINKIEEICYVSEKETEVLSSNKKPIVILKKKELSLIPEIVAPRQSKLGVMLPYTPLHHLLFDNELDTLIMTSGNISGMPIEYKNKDSINNLNRVADYFLINNRDIHIPTDDSVVKVVNNVESVIRRARGYTPYSVKVNTKNEIIAVGSEQKNTVCISKNGYAYLSQYLGDLDNLNCYKNFKYVINHFTNIFDIKPELLVHDMHPSYISTQYAKEQEIRKMEVQHHHAHMVSCMAEHFIYDSVIGIIFDGTGFGLDGAIWGGEFFIGNRSFFRRVGHLEYVYIQGGEEAIKEPWRCATSYLYALGYKPSEIIKGIDKEKVDIVNQALNSKLNCFLSSSIGRLFDAVASLIGVINNISYDGQAAIELENLIEEEIEESYLWDIIEINKVFQIQYKGIIDGILKDMKNKESVSKISSKFHNALAEASCALACKLREKECINKVVLSGGVFENQYLLKKAYKILINSGFEVFYNKQIPINDGGISFGQLHIASAITNKKG